MKRDLLNSALAIAVMTLVLGLAYPLVTTGVSQLVFGDQADGSQLEVDGEVVGSSLIAQPFKREAERGPGLERDPAYFQPRPSITGYSPDVTYFNNLGPNNEALSRYFANKAEAYLAREGEFTPGLQLADVPVDAVTTSASGVDPHISQANARIQANRVAEERGLDLQAVLALIDEYTDGRALGVLGEPGVNVLELNIALDEEGS
jgi:potassium-transporting ATPase KdpC subunit